MDAGTGVALYAAVVASGALGWNVLSAVRERRTDVHVEVEHGPEIGVDGWVGYRIEVIARNFGPREVVEDAGVRFEPEAESKTGFRHVVEIDEPLLPRDLVRWTATDLKRTHYDAKEDGRRFTAFVKLASGEVITSDVQEITDVSVAAAALDQPDKQMRAQIGEVEKGVMRVQIGEVEEGDREP